MAHPKARTIRGATQSQEAFGLIRALCTTGASRVNKTELDTIFELTALFLKYSD